MSHRRQFTHLGFFGWFLMAALGCSGDITSQAGEEKPSSGGSGTAPGGAGGGGNGDVANVSAPVMRRLTRTEFNYVVEDLLGDTSRPAKLFPAEENVEGFDNNAQALTLPPVMAQALMSLSPKLASLALVRGASTWAPCLEGQIDQACAETFLKAVGLRAWRRPVSDGELAQLMAVADRGRQNKDWLHGLNIATQSLLLSPAFLFRIEEGSGQKIPQKPGLVRPTGYEMAARLSFLLWRSLPDQELLNAAAEGKLDDAAAVKAQAQRMLDDDKAQRMVLDLHNQWWSLEKAEVINKDPEIFKNWKDELGPLFRAETQAFVAHLAREGKLSDLLSANFTFANKTLATYYGLGAITGDALKQVPLPQSSQRRGFLTHGSFLATHAGFDQSSPTLRGAFVRQRILCHDLPAPPETVDNTPPTITSAATTRERYQRISDDPTCAGCHKIMDPIGFGLEVFDGAGGLRSNDNGHPIDATGNVLSHPLGEFNGPIELSEGIAKSKAFTDCASKQWFRFAAGHLEAGDDDPSLERLQAEIQASDGNIRSLLLALTQTDDFLYLAKP